MASAAQAKEFINKIAPIIQREAKKRGYLVCSPIIAQACIESNFGLSLLASKYHNYFGLKCGSAWKGPSVNMRTKEEYNSQLVSIRDNFRVFPGGMEDGVKGYFDFINTKRYAKLKDAATPESYLYEIKKAGYATASGYINTNMSCIQKYDLVSWDNKEVNPYKKPTDIIKRGDRGDPVKWLQYALNKAGENLTIDGIYGEKTSQSVLKFQKLKNIFNGEIAGNNTIKHLDDV